MQDCAVTQIFENFFKNLKYFLSILYSKAVSFVVIQSKIEKKLGEMLIMQFLLEDVEHSHQEGLVEVELEDIMVPVVVADILAVELIIIILEMVLVVVLIMLELTKIILLAYNQVMVSC